MSKTEKSLNSESAPARQNTTESTLRFFPNFKNFQISTSEATINGVIGGSGPPLLLLHGWPQSHVEWHKITPTLSEHFTVVATDLRGYADSSKPADGENHEGYSKRSMARDQIEVMKQLGYERFLLVGHDRGGRTAHRMALDYPDAVLKIAVLDIVPTLKLYSVSVRKVCESFESACPARLMCESMPRTYQRDLPCGHPKPAPVTTAAICDIRVI